MLCPHENCATAVAQLDDLPIFFIPWGPNALILEKIKDTTERLWYASKVIEQGWSRIRQEKKDLHIDLLFYHLQLRCYIIVELICCAQHNSSYVA